MIIDTSAWIEFLDATGSQANRLVREAIEADARIVVPEVVRMELLIGGTDDAWAKQRRRFIDRFEVVALEPLVDAEDAAAIHRSCRRGGETVRSLIDCLIAAVAIRSSQEVLHRDRDFEAIARHTSLRTTSTL